MFALTQQLALFAKLMKMICVASCLASHTVTMIPVDETGQILAHHPHTHGESPWER